MAQSTSINVVWDSTGNIQHSISGIKPGPPRDNILLWTLAPSAPIFLVHQFGVMKPSHGLIACGRVIDIIFHNKYVILPINSALTEARLEFMYTRSPSIRFKFHPKHKLFANSDSVEEGVRQLLNNYTRYVFSQLGDYSRIVVRTFTAAAIEMYFDFIQDLQAKGRIGKGLDKWYPSFSRFAQEGITWLSSEYYVPEGGRTPDNEEWAGKQTHHLNSRRTKLESKRDSIFTLMGIY